MYEVLHSCFGRRSRNSEADIREFGCDICTYCIADRATQPITSITAALRSAPVASNSRRRRARVGHWPGAGTPSATATATNAATKQAKSNHGRPMPNMDEPKTKPAITRGLTYSPVRYSNARKMTTALHAHFRIMSRCSLIATLIHTASRLYLTSTPYTPNRESKAARPATGRRPSIMSDS
jgi:hypothetical protein